MWLKGDIRKAAKKVIFDNKNIWGDAVLTKATWGLDHSSLVHLPIPITQCLQHNHLINAC